MKIDVDVARISIRELHKWRKSVPPGETSLFLTLFDAVLRICGAISCNPDSRSAEDLVRAFCEQIRQLHNIANTDSFNGLQDQDSLELAVLEFVQLRSEAKDQAEQLATIENLEQQLAEFGETKAKVAQLEARLTELTESANLLAEHAELKAKLAQTDERYETLLTACAPLADFQIALNQIVPLLPEKVAKTTITPPVQPKTAFSDSAVDVDVAIVQWTTWLSEIDDRANDLQGHLEEDEAQLAEIEQGAKFGGELRNDEKRKLESAMQKIAEQQRELEGLSRLGREKLLKLRQLADSVKLLEVGIDDDTLVPPPLPNVTVEDVNTAEIVHLEEPPALPQVTDENALASVAYCNLMAEKHNMSPDVLLLVSLFELVPRTASGVTQKKGSNRVVRNALALGLVERFGITTRGQFFQGWKKEKSDALNQWLTFCGTCGRGGVKKYPMFKRNYSPLPWDPRCLFSPKEIVAFQKIIMEKMVATGTEAK